MPNARTIDVVAQALTGSRAEMRQNAVLSPGQIRELARGECGIVQALQISADLRTVYLACDNGLLAFQLADDLAVEGVRAMMASTIQVSAAREMEKTRYMLGADGRPVRIATEDR